MNRKYTTSQGDTWDIIAKKEYGNERQMHLLIAANPAHNRVLFFSAGVVLVVPEAPKVVATNPLPPWKQ